MTAKFIHPLTGAAYSSKFKPQVSIEHVTPELAALWLETSPRNRRLRDKRIDALAEALTNGAFLFNGASIVFDDEGRLLDSHHRLMACVRSGVGFDSVVVIGVDPKAKRNVDTGASRSLSDTLGEDKEVSTSALGATLTRLVRFERAIAGGGGEANFAADKSYVDPSTSLAYLDEHPEVRDAVRRAFELRDVLSPSRVAWLIHLTSRAKPRKSAEFFHKLATGENLEGTHPCHVLRNRLLLAMADRRARLKDSEYYAVLIKAWNAFVAGRPLTPRGLTWQMEPSGTKAPEAFPSLVL